MPTPDSPKLHEECKSCLFGTSIWSLNIKTKLSRGGSKFFISSLSATSPFLIIYLETSKHFWNIQFVTCCSTWEVTLLQSASHWTLGANVVKAWSLIFLVTRDSLLRWSMTNAVSGDG